MSSFNICAEYIHCLGKTVHKVANFQTKDEAVAWIEKRNAENKAPAPPKKDPSAFCRVTHCPLKIQRPRYYIRPEGRECT